MKPKKGTWPKPIVFPSRPIAFYAAAILKHRDDGKKTRLNSRPSANSEYGLDPAELFAGSLAHRETPTKLYKTKTRLYKTKLEGTA
jgi:hypothetical protein